jgi:hypothetical protein
MKPELYQEIALKRDIPTANLHRGNIATLVDYVPSPTGGEDGAVLEAITFAGWCVRSICYQF